MVLRLAQARLGSALPWLHGNIINEITTQPTTIVGSKKCKSFFKWNFFMSCIWLAPLRRAAPAAEAGTTRKTCPGHKWFLVLTKLLLWFNLRLLWLRLAEASWGWSCCISTTNGLDWAVLYSGPPEQEVRVYVCRPVVPGHPQILGDQLTLSQPRGQIMYFFYTPLDFQTFQWPCRAFLNPVPRRLNPISHGQGQLTVPQYTLLKNCQSSLKCSFFSDTLGQRNTIS